MRGDNTYKRCKCRTDEGKELGAKCPKLRRADGAWNPRHGVWYFRLEVPAADGQARKVMKRGGYDSRDDAAEARDAVVNLLSIPEKGPNGAADRAAVLTLVEETLRQRKPLPDYDEVRRRVRTGQRLDKVPTVAEWLTSWLAGRRTIKSATYRSYESHVRLYLVPHLGAVPLDRLRVAHVADMFAAIAAENERLAEVRADGTDEERAAVKGRRAVGAASQQRIRATLRKALNDAAREVEITVNPAALVEIASGKRPKAIVWTPERVEVWRANRARRVEAVAELGDARRCGDRYAAENLRREVDHLDATERPSRVMVWTAVQTGRFLDYATRDRLYALYHLVAFRGLRRGEACGIRWSDTDLDAGTIEVAEQLVQLGWEVEAGTPKSDSGARTVHLDAESVKELRVWRKTQLAERMRWGPAWTDSGRIFTREDGAELHPASVTDGFAVLLALAGLPPIRLHDLRHGAATLALSAGVDIKVVQELLGHSSSQITRDTYTSVVPELAREAAEKTAALVPRGKATGTDGLPLVSHTQK
ncbi:tyrosine-type recombinase/integrase [Actinosynnema sp. NPDC023587]|uniref:tyrosine-type recombinase/integrase n=1 Tax=Actinosynnema sp. NPDC023587 TaxID=3154695 RepID=UPI0033E444C9